MSTSTLNTKAPGTTAPAVALWSLTVIVLAALTKAVRVSPATRAGAPTSTISPRDAPDIVVVWSCDTLEAIEV